MAIFATPKRPRQMASLVFLGVPLALRSQLISTHMTLKLAGQQLRPCKCCMHAARQAGPLSAHLAVVPVLDGQDLVPDALAHVSLTTTPGRRQRQQHQARQLGAGLVHLGMGCRVGGVRHVAVKLQRVLTDLLNEHL